LCSQVIAKIAESDDKYRIMAVLKVETDTIRLSAILVIMYDEIFKNDFIVFIGNIIIC